MTSSAAQLKERAKTITALAEQSRTELQEQSLSIASFNNCLIMNLTGQVTLTQRRVECRGLFYSNYGHL